MAEGPNEKDGPEVTPEMIDAACLIIEDAFDASPLKAKGVVEDLLAVFEVQLLKRD